jgi:hypothetical protein
LFDVVLARQFQEIDCAVDVGFGVELRFAERRAYAGARGQVNDAVEVVLIENFFKRGAIANVDCGEFVSGIGYVFADVGAFYLGVL